MTRGEIAESLNIHRETLRYYETMGVITPVKDPRTGYRRYTETDKLKLNLLIRFKKFGFTLKEIKRFFDLAHNAEREKDEFNCFLFEKIRELDTTIKGLKEVKESLTLFMEKEDKESCALLSQFIKSS